MLKIKAAAANMKFLLIAAALTLCCCVGSLQAHSVRRNCYCIQTSWDPVPARAIQKLEVFLPSGQCRRSQIVITKRSGSKVCINPEAKWIQELLNTLQNKNVTSTAVPATASV
ncbi:C-C motif chemokine 5-like isoform X2 [Parambassis ranga]|uniref:C-C motif chemokine 5-like isoform X2 n=1 Tax=Parambassis ranga TaxID=210632 RepID=A0A6P7J331_9TELE|nr:C-X-C motif chemokine 13 isoform X2 [Parambassis ranga]